MVKILKHKLRNIFITGLLVTLPIMITFFFIRVLFRMIDNLLGPTVNGILTTMGLHFIIPGMGFILTILIIFAVGLASTNVLGKKIFERFEIFLDNIPMVKSIYSGAKQVIHTIATAKKAAFSRVVLVQFPRNGIYSVGFITSEAQGEVQDVTEEDVINVFVPTVPNPTTGFLLMVPKEDITYLNMSIEDGIKLIMSGGIVTPTYSNNKNPSPQISSVVNTPKP
jgi:uncharacterized membrane protein